MQKKFSHKTDIFFDLDHTLWDFEKNSALAFETIFEKHQLHFDLALFLRHYVPTNLKYWKLFREEKISQVDLRYHRLKEVFNLMNQPVEDELIHLLSKEYIDYLPTFSHLYDGTIELLDYLKTKPYRLHIITNGFQDVQAFKMKNAKIDHYFETVTDSDQAGVKKPHPLIFEKAIQKANTSFSSSLMIGDSWEADIEGAHNVGLNAIYFNEHKQPFPKQPVIDEITTLLELKKYL
ncbi:MAG: YjjG family noncanonical pyrimidine nucleotidase [Flavobacterium sp.]